MNKIGSKSRWKKLLWFAGVSAILFGAATLVEGWAVLRLGRDTWPKGVVPFVLVFNFSAGFFYIATGLGILARRPWAIWGARLLALLTALVFLALGIHIALGSDYMNRTILAMTLRTGFWLGQSLLLARIFRNP